MSVIAKLEAGIAALGLNVPDEASQRLFAYLELLAKWNRTYNLTAIRDIDEMVSQHILDSLTVLPYLEKLALAGRHPGFRDACIASGAGCEAAPAEQARREHPFRLADVGSGAGLPGIPLAIVSPRLQVTLIEAVDKKSAFQRQAKAELGLANVTVAGTRVEAMAAGGFDVVVSRAFAELADFVALAGRLANPHGRLYAMKGVLPDGEIQRLPSPWRVEEVQPLKIPDLPAQRHLIVLGKI